MTMEWSGPSYGKEFLEVRRLGTTRYEDVYELQKSLLEQRIADEIGDVLLLTEHEPVVTLGRKSDRAAAEGLGLPVFEIERGGDATYHGPGQVVAYPILKLPESRRDLHRYLRDLEQVVIDLLAEFSIAGERKPGLTGVWIGDRKVCSMGVAVRRWVTWHGLALNVHTDLGAFQEFRPCGLDPGVMTRLADHVDIPEASVLQEVLLVRHFCNVFALTLPEPPGPPADPEPGLGPRLPILPG